MKAWKYRSGATAKNSSEHVELPTSASSTTTSARGEGDEAVARGPAGRDLLAEGVVGACDPSVRVRRDGRGPGPGQGRGDDERGRAAERGDRTLREVGGERQAVPAVLVLDLGHPLALHRPGEDDRRPVAVAGLREGGVDRGEVVPVDLDRVAAEGGDVGRVGVKVPAELGRTALPQPVDVDDRREVVELVVGGLVEGLPDRALGELAVPAEHPRPVGELVEELPGEGDATAAATPSPSDPVARSTQGSAGVGWPCRRAPKRRYVEMSSPSPMTPTARKTE